MCGIVGYVGNELSQKIIINGLERLEYRGYDSAGIAIVNNESVILTKEKGRIKNLKNLLTKVDGKLGIGHTRWATHGRANKLNSHPHQSFSKRFTIVHNGIIENYEGLKNDHKIKPLSNTDTEIIVHLLELFSKHHKNTVDIIKEVMNIIEGSYAFGIIDLEDKDNLYFARNKSPLLIGIGDSFNMIGSDAIAMIGKTNHFYELEDKDYGFINKDSINIYNNGNKVIRNKFISNINTNDISKGIYKHYMLKEIDEQSSVIRNLISQYISKEKVSNDILNMFNGVTRLYIIAAGTSYHAGMVAKSFFEKIANIPTEVHVASEFAYSQPLIKEEKPLFIFISQSGETADLRSSLKFIRENNYKVLTITNVDKSTLSREADNTMLIHAGPEIAVASTKAYTAQLTALAILANSIANSPINLEFELSKVALSIEDVIYQKQKIKKWALDMTKNTKSCFYIGRGIDSISSLEAALKLKEVSYIQTEGFAAGELKHGTIALIENNIPVFAFITQRKTAMMIRSNIEEVKARGAKTLVITSKSLSKGNDEIVFPDVLEILAPIVAIVPSFLIAYYCAIDRGNDVDNPRNLAKSVTVE